ncbi:unnamed protein product [Prunus armeniaca]|uniref:Uncharacterized protein n=1 Tax=Prunus armeniaca TaxID=36596 RepID=A0A6J5UHJ1_PRUAR|nr:unnamed protein product [Prunus armeniaca]CAB4306002.1 unnamed protein product [Prunus armeniaca]
MEWTLKEWTSERHTWDENGMRPSGFQIPPLSSYFLFVVKNYPVGSSRVILGCFFFFITL